MILRDIYVQRVLAPILSLGAVFLVTSCERTVDQIGLPAELSEIGSRSSVPTYPVEQMDLLVELERVARVQSVRRLELYFQENGRLSDLRVTAGDQVAQGQILARLESSSIQHNLRLAEIDVEIDRLRAASKAPISSDIERQVHQLELAKRKETAAFLRRRLEAHTIRAPYDGVIIQVNPEVDEVVEGFHTIIEIADPSELELQIEVSIDQFNRVMVGQVASVEIKNNTWSPAVVSRLTSRTLGRGSSLRRDEYIVHLRMEDAALSFRMGGRHSARVQLDYRPDALVVPLSALREFKGRTYVRVLTGVQRREVDVKVGVRTNTRVEIIEGLQAGQIVIGK